MSPKNFEDKLQFLVDIYRRKEVFGQRYKHGPQASRIHVGSDGSYYFQDIFGKPMHISRCWIKVGQRNTEDRRTYPFLREETKVPLQK